MYHHAQQMGVARAPDPHVPPRHGAPARARRRVGGVTLLVAALLLLATSSGMAAVLGLPSDGPQVNNDPASGIDPNQSAGHSDVVGGTLTPAGPRVHGRRSSSNPAARNRSSSGRSKTDSG